MQSMQRVGEMVKSIAFSRIILTKEKKVRNVSVTIGKYVNKLINNTILNTAFVKSVQLINRT